MALGSIGQAHRGTHCNLLRPKVRPPATDTPNMPHIMQKFANVDMPSRQDELLAVDTARMRSCQRWEEGVRQRSAIEAVAEMSAVAVCSARSGCFACGMVSGDGGGTAEHAGVGQERLTTKLRITLLPGTVISRSSTSSA